MTLTNISLVAIGVCVLWMLKSATYAMPLTLPSERAAETDHLATEQDTMVQTRLVSSEGSRNAGLLSADVQGESALSSESWPFPSGDAGTDSTFGFSQGLTGLLTPVMPARTMVSGPLGDGRFTSSLGGGLPFLHSGHEAGFVQPLGPLALDIYAITFTGLYSDLKQGQARAADDGGFLAAISLQGALTLSLGESAYLGIGFTVYYLPTVNRTGLYFGNGGAATSAVFRYETDLGRWHVTVADDARVFHPLDDLLDDYEVDEVAVAGRYRFGRPEGLGNRPFFAEDIYYLNTVSATASTQLDEYWTLQTHVGHRDVWTTSDFGDVSNQIFAGASLSYDSPEYWAKPWLSYNYYELENEKLLQSHQLMAGVSLPFTPTFQLSARAGWLFFDYDGIANRQHVLWELGAVHRINERLTHSLFGGYTQAITDYGDAFVGSYWRYTLAYRPEGSNWQFSAIVRGDDNDYDGTRGLSYGLQATCAVTETTRLTFTGAKAHYVRAGLDYDRWILRASLYHAFSPSITGILSYQYSDYSDPNPLLMMEEQLVTLSLRKSF